jgi:subtilase family serine protease
MSHIASSRRLQRLLFRGGALALVGLVFSVEGCEPTDLGEEQAEHTSSTSADQEALSAIQELPHKAVCDVPAEPGLMRCHAHVRTDAGGTITPNATTPSGLFPADLISAYKVPAGGTGTVAIVDAMDDPNAESDLATYRAQFGLPPCTTANGCFKKVNQNGQASPLPASNVGWAEEISLDLDMVSAICPGCKILLVEATSATIANLGAAVNRAATMGANAISNSYGGGESTSDPTFDSEFYNHPGILITASSGDGGFGVEYPAAGQFVLGVGGTSLTKSTSTRGWAEAAWSGAGSGCSRRTTKPSFQKDTGCANRTVADVSAVANPSTGVAVFDTFGNVGGWLVFGGTSVASPLVASIFVATGNGAVTNGFPYANTGLFFDVTTGSNGTCSASAKYLCTAGVGYDGPTGLGTPNAALFP